MTPPLRCLIFTKQHSWADEIFRMVQERSNPEHIQDLAESRRYLEVFQRCIALIDVRHQGAFELIAYINRHLPYCEILAFATPRSDPFIQASNMGVFETLPLKIERTELLKTLGYAARLVNHHATASSVPPRYHAQETTSPSSAPIGAQTSSVNPDLHHFSSSLKQISDLDLFLDRVVEGIDASLKISRAAIFIRNAETNEFTCRTGKNIPETLLNKTYNQSDSFSNFLICQPHLINTDLTDHLTANAGSEAVLQELAFQQVKILIPLITKNSLEGWIMLGHRLSGMPYDQNDVHDLAIVGDHISTMLENVLLLEDTAVQRTLASTLLHTIPSGIIAVNLEGIIQWFNESAENILNPLEEAVIGNPIDVLGATIANLLHKVMIGESIVLHENWVDPQSNKHLKVEARKLLSNGECVGALAIVQDQTNKLWLEEKRKKAERTAFWAELAAAMSHEIRNPLVAINTFAQLITERYNDPEFRDQFSARVQYEVQRLNNIIEQINDFGNPPALDFKPVNLAEILGDTAHESLQLFHEQEVNINIDIEDELPSIIGDSQALKDCFSHLITNAIESASTDDSFELNISAEPKNTDNENASIVINIKDSGRGIPDDLKENLFSPFCTTKARGMGLGLPIAQRTVLDHNGRMHIQSGKEGTSVSIILPSTKPTGA